MQRFLQSRFMFLLGVIFLLSTDAVAEPLRYKIHNDEEVAYRVNIVFESPAEKHTMSGVIVYTGQESKDDEISLRYDGGLNSVKRSKSSSRRGPSRFGGRRPGGGPPGSPFANRGGVSFDGLRQTTSQIVLKPNGDVVTIKSETHVPYLLGHLSLLPFESLPDGDEQRWQAGNGITVTEQESSGFPPVGPFRNTKTTVKTGGSELAKYEIKKSESGLVTIEKDYRLVSPAIDEDDSAVTMTGVGTLIFNAQDGVTESLKIQYDFEVEVDKSKMTMPLTIDLQRLSSDELKAHREKEEFVKNNPGVNSGDEPWTKEVQDNIIAELNSDDIHVVRRRLVRLAARLPYLEETAVAKAIAPLLSTPPGQTRNMVGMAWKRWKVILPKDEVAKLEEAARESASDPKDEPMPVAQATTVREWTDSTGKHKIKATFVEVKDGTVVLRQAVGGKDVHIPLNKLSAADQELIEELQNPADDNPFEVQQ